MKKIEPVAEAQCRRQGGFRNCDFQIVVDAASNRPPNAHQFLSATGRPVLSFSIALIETVKNPDEMAFIMGHEAAHHIAGHLQRQQISARQGAAILGQIASLSGAGTAEIKSAQELGAVLGARRYSKDFELEADALGARITLDAGFDPVVGAVFFTRLPDPGNQFLGTHPPNADRINTVRHVASRR